MSKRKIWIDLMRGCCMLAILVHHTEIYYVEEAVIDYRLFVDNALCCFFFVSGYLFFKNTPFDLRKKMIAIFRTIVIPYFIFMTIIAFPKAMAHGNFTSVLDILLSILLGQQSWFITALAIAEVLFSLLLYFSKKKMWILPIGVSSLFLSAVLLTGNELFLAHNYWNIMDALLAVAFLYLGYLYHKHEDFFDHINITYYIIPIILFIISKYVILKYGVYCYLGSLNIDNYLVFMTDNILAIMLLTKLTKTLIDIKALSWMGSHVIVYYFLCGGVPMTLSIMAQKCGFIYDGAYYKVVIMVILVYLCITLMTWLIYRYIPWVTGRVRE